MPRRITECFFVKIIVVYEIKNKVQEESSAFLIAYWFMFSLLLIIIINNKYGIYIALYPDAIIFNNYLPKAK